MRLCEDVDCGKRLETDGGGGGTEAIGPRDGMVCEVDMRGGWGAADDQDEDTGGGGG